MKLFFEGISDDWTLEERHFVMEETLRRIAQIAYKEQPEKLWTKDDIGWIICRLSSLFNDGSGDEVLNGAKGTDLFMQYLRENRKAILEFAGLPVEIPPKAA